MITRKHILDNEVSETLKTIIQDEYKMQLELVPSVTHNRNLAHVTIRNFKAHFLSIPAVTTPDFVPPMWYRLLLQAGITINLLRQSNATPNMSAYAHLSGPFNYKKMPLAPMGISVKVHENIDKRGTWAYNTVEGWSLATSPEQYRTHKCHIKSTNRERFTDTIHFNHNKSAGTTITHADKVMASIEDYAKAIKNLGNGNRGE